MSDTVSWNLQMSVREGQLSDARDLMPEMVEATRGEAGTLGYEWFLGGDGTVCHIYERMLTPMPRWFTSATSAPSSPSASSSASSRPVYLFTANRATRREQPSTAWAPCTSGLSVALAVSRPSSGDAVQQAIATSVRASQELASLGLGKAHISGLVTGSQQLFVVCLPG